MYFAVPILRPGVPGGAWSLSTFITFCHRQNKTNALDHMFFLQNRHPLNNRMEDMSATPTGKNRAEPISYLSILVNFMWLHLCLTQSTDENTWVEKMKYKWIHPKRTKERKSRSGSSAWITSCAIAGSRIVFSGIAGSRIVFSGWCLAPEILQTAPRDVELGGLTLQAIFFVHFVS